MDKLKKYWWLFPFLSLAAVYFSTISFPLLTGDEAAFADYALHGDLKLWDAILYGPYNMVKSYYGFGVIPIHMAALRFALTTFGISVFSVRIISTSCFVASLLILFFLVRRWRFPWFAYIGLIFYMASFSALSWGRNGRPEGIVLFIMMLNFAWFTLGGNAFCAFGAGFLSGLAWGIHPAIIFFFFSASCLVLFSYQKNKDLPKGLLWWMSGAVAGFLVVLYSLDIDGFLRCLKYSHGEVVFPPMIRWIRNLPLLLSNFVIRLSFEPRSVQPHISIVYPFLGVLIGFFIWHVRRIREAMPHERNVIIITLSLLFAYAFFSASPSHYVVYFYPWLLLELSLLIGWLLTGRLKLEKGDLFLFSSVNIFIGSIQGHPRWEFWLFPFFLWLLISSFELKSKATWIGVAILFFSAMANLDFYVLMALTLANVWKWNRALAIGLCVYPWVIFQKNSLPIRIRFLKWTSSENVMAMYACAVMAVYFIQGCNHIWLAAKMDRMSDEFRQELMRVSSAERVVAPDELWLFAKFKDFQSSTAMFRAKGDMPSYDPSFALNQYNPTVLLWPKSALSIFQTSDTDQKWVNLIRQGRTLYSPFGELQEVWLTPHEQGHP